MHKLWLLLALLPVTAHTSTFNEKLLADSDPTAFDVSPLAAEDFSVDWPQAPKGATAKIVPGSLQWVRVDELLVVPRGLLEISTQDEGSAEAAGVSQPLINGKARLLVPLASGDTNQITVRTKSGESKIRLKLNTHKGENLYFDTSCSRAPVRLIENSLPADTFVYIGCRRVQAQGEGSEHHELDLLIYADNAGTLAIPSVDANRWNIRLTSQSKETTLSFPKGNLRLGSNLPEKSHRAFLGAGIGPYAYKLEKGAIKEKTTLPLATVYSAYSLTNTHRLVFFGALALHKHAYSDLGGYFQFESFRGFDRRISLNLLVGVHGFSYTLDRSTTNRLNFPQGFEFFYYDFLGKGMNASFGGFLQPPINEKSYYNTWLRWGPASWFIEANYISITEPGFLLHTYGLSVGLPLLSFL